MSSAKLILAALAAVACIWSQALADEEELSLTLSADSTEVLVAEPVAIHIMVTNVSQNDVVVPVTWEEGFFSGTLSRGDNLEEWSFLDVSVRVRQRGVTLRPGETYERSKRFSEIAPRQPPGTYVLQGKLESPGVIVAGIKGETTPCWKGSISAKPLQLVVKNPPKPGDVEALKILTARWGGLKTANLAYVWSLSGNEEQELLLGREVRFQTIIKKHPDSVYAPYCRLRLASAYAENYDGLGDFYDKGVEYVKGLLEMGPAFRFADEAELTLAKLYLRNAHFGRFPPSEAVAKRQALRDLAKPHLRHVMEAYPWSFPAEQAKQLLESLEKNAGQKPPAPPSQPSEAPKDAPGEGGAPEPPGPPRP